MIVVNTLCDTYIYVDVLLVSEEEFCHRNYMSRRLILQAYMRHMVDYQVTSSPLVTA